MHSLAEGGRTEQQSSVTALPTGRSGSEYAFAKVESGHSAAFLSNAMAGVQRIADLA